MDPSSRDPRLCFPPCGMSQPAQGTTGCPSAVRSRLWCQLALGSAGWLSLLSLPWDHAGGDVPLPGRDMSLLGPPQAAGLCLTQPGEQVLCSLQGLSGEGGCASAFGGFPGVGL